jgi:hypothetical protein
VFYVYLWLRENGTPYYVGKGTGHRGFTSTRHSVHRPPSRDHIIIQNFATESEAFEAEKFFIEFYGRVDLGTGCLHNHAEGGLGGSAAANGRYNRTETHRQQLRERMKSGDAAKAGRAGGRRKGCKHSPEEIAIRSSAIRAAWTRRKCAPTG